MDPNYINYLIATKLVSVETIYRALGLDYDEECRLMAQYNYSINQSSKCGGGGCGSCSSSCNSKDCDDCDDDCNDNSKKCSTKKSSYSKNGCYCRSCNEYNEYAEPDEVIEDNKFTCFVCGNHPDRKGKGLPNDKVAEIDKIYSKKS